MTREQLISMMKHAPEKVITVIGDYCLDKYLYVDPDRDEPSIETGLTAYQVVGKKVFAGAAGTVVNNLRALTAKVLCVGVIGEDGEGYEMMRELAATGADNSFMIKDMSRCTSTYTKPMRRTADGYKEMNRFDFKNFEPMKPDVEAKVIENMRKAAAVSHAFVIVDQFAEADCGVVNTNVRNAIVDIAKLYPDLIIYADSRAFIHLFRDMIIKCINFEVVKSIDPSYTGEPDEQKVCESGLELYKKNNRPVFVTMGSKGIMSFDQTGRSIVPALKVPGPFDIVGAGDAASSGIVLGLALGCSSQDACLLANIVASITIQQIGVTGTATPAQVIERFEKFVV
jgi:rfaE bifunctional protein kinase chain/domain